MLKAFVLLVVVCVVGAGINTLIIVSAAPESAAHSRFVVDGQAFSPPQVEGVDSPFIKLKAGKAIGTEYSGPASLIEKFEHGQLAPRALAAGDINFDGFPDVVSGYAVEGGGVLTFHRGSKDAFSPGGDEVLQGLSRGEYPPAFEKKAEVLAVPVSPDFILTGNFLRDSRLDLIVASRGDRSLYLFSSDESGAFVHVGSIDLGGAITALAADRVDIEKQYFSLVAAVDTKYASELILFNGKGDIRSDVREKFQIAKAVKSLRLASPEGKIFDRDLFILADGRILRIPQIGAGLRGPQLIDMPHQVMDFALGEFIGDRRIKTELAVLAADGSVYILQNGHLDTRPFTEKEVRALHADYGRGSEMPIDSRDQSSSLADDWSIAEEHHLGIRADFVQSPQSLLQKARITGGPTDDLLVLNHSKDAVSVLFREPYDAGKGTRGGAAKFENINFSNSPVAVLPVRLNVMGQQGFVTLESGKPEPTPVMFVPNATFSVNAGSDQTDASPGNGVCASSTGQCTIRAAVQEANALLGADTIIVPSGTYTLSLFGVENNAATGDLDVREQLTVVGSGSGSTIIQAGSGPGTGVDKVMSINPTFTSAFATSISGVTLRHGRNMSSISVDGFGGGLDWEGSGTGSLDMANVFITDNRTTDGYGGGFAGTSYPAGPATVTLSNATVNGNLAAASSPGPYGGGMFFGPDMRFVISNVVVSGNSGSAGFFLGGGIYAEEPGGSAGISTISGTTITGNSAYSGGGIYTLQPLSFTAPINFTSNSSSSGGGGGIYISTSGTINMSKAVFTGNSAQSGAAIYKGGSGTLNLSYLRIVGNTSQDNKSLTVSGGTINAENNWWGCNTGPGSSPCDMAGHTITSSAILDFTPWLQLRLTAATNPTVVGQTSTLTASFLTNSAGGAVSGSNLDALTGLTVSWSSSAGASVLNQQTAVQAGGTATATFTGTAASPPARTASAAVNSATATVNITVEKANTTSFITGRSATGTVAGQSFTVSYSVAVNSPGAGLPGGTVTVSDGVDSCTASVSAGSCTLTLMTTGTRTLTATYSGDSNFNSSVSSGVSHTVTGPTSSSVSISGRVMTAGGQGIYGARISVVGADGRTYTALTNQFGNYRVDGLPAGDGYTVRAGHKAYSFSPRIVNAGDDVTELNFTPVQ